MAEKKPVLVLGWGKQGCDDVEWIARVFRRDESIDCAASQFADSRDVLATVAGWFKDHINPQTLYLGAHGEKTGLTRAAKGKAKVGYRELSDAIAESRHRDAPAVNIVLGACKSSNAAAIWTTIKQEGINSLIAFPEEPDSDTVQEVLTEVLLQGNIVELGAARAEREIVSLDDWVREMRQRFPQVSFHYKGEQSQLVDVQTLPTDGEASFSELLTKQGALKPGHPLLKVAALASKLPDVAPSVVVPTEEQEPTPLKIRGLVSTRKVRKKP